MADTIYQTCTANIDEADIGSLLKCVADQAQSVRTLSRAIAIAIDVLLSCHVNVKICA